MTDTSPGTTTPAYGWPGSWESITREEYWEIIGENGGLDALKVAAGCTHPRGENYVSTTWARPGEDYPLVQSEMRGCDRGLSQRDYEKCSGVHTFSRFIYDPAMEDE